MKDPKNALLHAYEGKWLQPYAASKFKGERALRTANSDTLMTVAVAPHQVRWPKLYGYFGL